MLNMMVVDDEEHARTGIKSVIDWNEYGINIVAEACDGAEALELLDELHVDILLADIRMPEIDGLELIEIVNKTYPHIKSIIMSGFEEFDYAKQAMKLGANDYLVKPSRTQEIVDTVLRVTRVIQEEKEQAERLERLKEGFRESLPMVKEKALSKLIASEDASRNKLLNLLAIGGLVFPHRYFGIARIQIDHHQGDQADDTVDFEWKKFSIINICEETFQPLCFCVAFEDQDDLVAILNSEESMDVSQVTTVVQQLKANVKKYLNLSISVALGSIDKTINQLHNANLHATHALDSRFFMGSGKVLNYEELPEEEPRESSYPIELEELIIQAISAGDHKKLTECIQLFRQILHSEITFKDRVLKPTFALFFALYRFCIEKGLEVDDIFGQNLNTFVQKFTRSDLDSIYSELLEIALSISKKFNEKKQNNQLLESAIDFIRENYNKDINRETVANAVYITPGYLSLLFKQHMKMNFLDYLHKVRMEQACELLKNPGLRIADIALNVGYNDEKYFFQVFKKYIGMTPKQYRNTIAG